ncbi:hypothetical protein AEQ67_13490 [Pseudomonas sp. RIT-PI-q]|uniref:hypothetical protein n=1 Tax=Pseudomonas sp. RIT-PI-q TaxID=1690247 RepID=UPI0006CC1E44|nr:hypothetical protein [Pseudomonas sp. RIT-PI-q]KPG98361.1 hypothetical protein AEQ67_13490 [Pseudomonas sp. RIT-PI-q]
MSDHSELKTVAEACGNLNWRVIQENWCEWAIRDDHAYIATMRTNSPKQPGPCPEREAKAKFLCVMTPATALTLITEIEHITQYRDNAVNIIRRLRGDLTAVERERDQLKAEIERQSRQFKEWQASHHANYSQVADERDQIDAESETLRKDADRLNWLDARKFPVVEGDDFGLPVQGSEQLGHEWTVSGGCTSIRKAIDDAISREAQ